MRFTSMLLGAVFTTLMATAHAEENLTAYPYCSARGFAGSTVESAIAACMAAGFNGYICGRDVVCSAGMQVCSAQGFAGTTIESAIRACKQAGFQAYVCGRNVSCHD